MNNRTDPSDDGWSEILGTVNPNPPEGVFTIENETQAINAILAGIKWIVKQTVKEALREPKT